MSELHIHWKVERIDEGEEQDPRLAECLLEIEGRIEFEGRPAGIVDAFYLFSERPASRRAFFELWDADAISCDLYGQISSEEPGRFRKPISSFLDPASGLLCVNFIALRPAFRGMGLGGKVMREFVRVMADPRIGLVLLNATPLQHRPGGYDDFDEEVRELPWNSPDEDQDSLLRHFKGWGMQRLPATPFMIAAPETLRDVKTMQWPPCPILDHWNTCHFCGGWIDREGSEWVDCEDGLFHKDCDEKSK